MFKKNPDLHLPTKPTFVILGLKDVCKLSVQMWISQTVLIDLNKPLSECTTRRGEGGAYGFNYGTEVMTVTSIHFKRYIPMGKTLRVQ